MLSQAMQTAMNEQINHELASAYAYLSVSAYFEGQNLPGMARWMRVQAEEELAHAMRFFDQIHERGGQVRLMAIAQPPVDFGAPIQAFEAGLANERKVTEQINRLFALAVKEGDFASQVFLNWFVTEQVEEEKSATQVIETLRMVGDSQPALLMLDRELGQRQAEAG